MRLASLGQSEAMTRRATRSRRQRQAVKMSRRRPFLVRPCLWATFCSLPACPSVSAGGRRLQEGGGGISGGGRPAHMVYVGCTTEEPRLLPLGPPPLFRSPLTVNGGKSMFVSNTRTGDSPARRILLFPSAASPAAGHDAAPGDTRPFSRIQRLGNSLDIHHLDQDVRGAL